MEPQKNHVQPTSLRYMLRDYLFHELYSKITRFCQAMLDILRGTPSPNTCLAQVSPTISRSRCPGLSILTVRLTLALCPTYLRLQQSFVAS